MSDFKGKFFLPTDADFTEAVFSRVFNHRRPTDRLPSAVLRAADVDDVIAGVKWAKANNLAVTVRSGGHSWAAWSVQNDTLLIDLEHLTEARYDEATGIAWAQPAIQGGNVLDPFLAERGRFFNGGHCPPVGVGGFFVGWVIQFVGHYFEGRKPAFFDDVMGLAIGPLFVVAEVLFKLGAYAQLQREIEERAGPLRP